MTEKSSEKSFYKSKGIIAAVIISGIIAVFTFTNHSITPTNITNSATSTQQSKFVSEESRLSPVDQASASLADKQIIAIDATWPSYPTLKQLVTNSTDVVLGHVEGIKAVHDDTPIPLTDFSYTIDKVAKGNLVPGDVITIRQTGIETPKTTIVLKEDPLLTSRQSFVGFLRYSVDHDVYVIVGGPQGRFIERNGTVSSLDGIYPEDAYVYPSLKMKDVSVAQLFSQVIAEANVR